MASTDLPLAKVFLSQVWHSKTKVFLWEKIFTPRRKFFWDESKSILGQKLATLHFSFQGSDSAPCWLSWQTFSARFQLHSRLINFWYSTNIPYYDGHSDKPLLRKPRTNLSRSIPLQKDYTTCSQKMFHRCGGDPEISEFEQFLLVYLAIGLSATSPSRKPSSRSRTSDMKTGCNRDSVVSMASPSVESFDIIGLRFYSTLDYLNVGSFDIPGNSLIITQANATSLTLSSWFVRWPQIYSDQYIYLSIWKALIFDTAVKLLKWQNVSPGDISPIMSPAFYKDRSKYFSFTKPHQHYFPYMDFLFEILMLI